jgi:GGDEF domain-containing protein
MINNVAETLMELFAETDIIGRIDEDEFSVFAPNMTDEGYIGDMSGRILKCIRRGYSSEGKDVMFSASIGAAIYKDSDDEYSTLKEHASQALRTVQNDGGDGFSLYRVL